MSKTVVIVGALDTKGREFEFLKSLIEQHGVQTLVIDIGVLGEPYFAPDIGREEVARAGGAEIEVLRTGDKKDQAMKVMASGLAKIIRNLYDTGQLDGIISMGGTGGTSVATAGMRNLPVGVPKVMVSTVGGGDVSSYCDGKDICFFPSIVDVAGLNRVSRAIYANAAGAIAGMVMTHVPPVQEKPIITASMFGNTTACVDRAREILEGLGFEVLVFHATGIGGRTMERIVEDGYAVACLDLTTTELADEVCGGVFSAGKDRMMATARAGIPTVLAPGCVDMCNFHGMDTVPEKYRHRQLYRWNPNVTLMRTNEEENRLIGRMIAEAANASKGPVAILLPLKGVSMLDSPGGSFWNPEADESCFRAIKEHAKPGVQVIEVDANINDPEFPETAVRVLMDMIQK